jgi:hypothetical protein
MIVNREADRREGPGIDESQAIGVAALYSILEMWSQSQVPCRSGMALTSKYDPPLPLAEYCPKPLMVYTPLVDRQPT